MFFDPDFEPMVTSKTPGEDQDILESSANNLYVDVTMADLEGFQEQHQLNSRLVKKDGKLVEEVYKVGGLYDRELKNVVSHLRNAIPFAPKPLAKALKALIRFYETGLDSDRQDFDIAWVQNRDSDIDTMNGFIEVYMDARGMKGSWEGLVITPTTTRPRRFARWRSMRSGSRITCRWIRISEAEGPWRVGAGHRGGARSGGLGSDHADWRQPAQRSAHPRDPRQQVRVDVERPRRVRAGAARQVSPGVCLG